MKLTYKLIENDFNMSYIERTEENGTISYIPLDEANSDYQAYLASLDEQQAALKDK